MQTSLSTQQAAPQKVKNILVRHTCSKKVQRNSHYQHPESSYILKYAPKYYKNLTVCITCQNPLLSKIKKIKKLKAFTGYFDRYLPNQLWFDLLGNTRKEIEEMPQISSKNRNLRPRESFWKRLNQQKLKNFWNVTRIWLPKWRIAYLMDNSDKFLSSKEQFVKYLWNMRRLKSLKIMVKDDNYEKVKWVLEKVNRMGKLLSRLQTLSLDVRTHNNNIQELFRNKIFFSCLTGLDLCGGFDPIFAEVPLTCKNLNSLSLDFQSGVDERSEFKTLLTSIQDLTQLKRLELAWPPDGKHLWSHFKPQPSLEYFHLKFGAHNLTNTEFLGEGKDWVGHWEPLKELKTLEFSPFCWNYTELNLVKTFMTKVLKKVQKLEELKFLMTGPLKRDDFQDTYEPLFVEDVPHLYDSLERFEYELYSSRDGGFGKFDMKTLKPFRNLKSLRLEGNISDSSENLEEIVRLLEGNQKEGEYPFLKLNLKKSINSPADWLRETLRILERTKKAEKNLKVEIDLGLGMKGYLEVLEELCGAIQLANAIQGLGIRLDFNEEYYDSSLAIEKARELPKRYPGIRNLNVRVFSEVEGFEWIKMDGEKEQFLVYTY